MSIISKTTKNLNKLLKIDVFNSVYYRIRFSLPRNVIFHVYPRSILKIDRNAELRISNGEVLINASWSRGRQRRNASELVLCNNSKLIIDGNFTLYQGASIYVGKGATLYIKGNSFLNTNTVLNCFSYIEIGKGTMISDDVRIQDSDNHIIDGDESRLSAPIIIKDHVWIGKNVTILKGVTISEGAVIGAGSVVTKDVPPNCVVVGNPAQVIKKINTWK